MHVLNRGDCGVRSPADALARQAATLVTPAESWRLCKHGYNALSVIGSMRARQQTRTYR